MLMEKPDVGIPAEDDATPPLRVAICGEVSSGKSTVLNMLLRGRFLPDNIGLQSRPLVVAGYGARPGAEILQANGTRATTGLDGDPDLFRNAARLRLWSDHAHMKGLELVEVPLTKAEELSDAQVELIRSADVMIWVTIASQAWRLTEKTIVEALGLRPESCILAVSRADKLRCDDDRARMKDRLDRETAAYFGRCIFVHGGRAALGQSAASDEAWARTGGAGIVAALDDLAAGLPPLAWKPEIEVSLGELDPDDAKKLAVFRATPRAAAQPARPAQAIPAARPVPDTPPAPAARGGRRGKAARAARQEQQAARTVAAAANPATAKPVASEPKPTTSTAAKPVVSDVTAAAAKPAASDAKPATPAAAKPTVSDAKPAASQANPAKPAASQAKPGTSAQTKPATPAKASPTAQTGSKAPAKAQPAGDAAKARTSETPSATPRQDKAPAEPTATPQPAPADPVIAKIQADALRQVADSLPGSPVMGFCPHGDGNCQVLSGDPEICRGIAAFCQRTAADLARSFPPDGPGGPMSSLVLSTHSNRVLFQDLPGLGLIFLMVDAAVTNHGIAQSALSRLARLGEAG